MADFRVKCADFNVLETILNEVTKQFEKEVQNYPGISAEAKDKSCKQFREVFRATIKGNVKYVGPPLDANDATDDQPEIMTKDDEMLQHFNTVLYPQLTSVIVEVAQKRKTYPGQCCQPLRKRFHQELEQVKNELGAAKAVDPSTSKEPEPSCSLTKDGLLELARSSSTNLAQFKKSIEPLVKRAGRLKLAQELWKKNRNPPTAEESDKT